MARIKISHEWPDGDRLTVEVALSESYPDAVAEARANAKTLWLDILGVTVETLAADDDG
jgi:hypothetical protein